LSSSRGKPHVAPFVGPPWPIAAAWLIAAVLAQATVVHYASVRGVVPSVVLVVVVWYAVRVDPLRAAAYGLAAGLCEDVLAGQTGAAWTISTVVTAGLTSLLSRGFFADSIPLAATITIVATLVRALLFWTTMSLQGYPGGLGAMHFRQALVAATLNVATMIAAMLVARRFDVRDA
jgi:rod shape-determining protein MreD